MPRFENSPANVSASIEVFPKDDYEFIVGEPKTFFGQTKSGKNQGKDSYGVRFSIAVGKGDYQGKRQVISLYQQSEESQGMGKQFIMAVLGYDKGKAEEERFNADWGGKDWSFDTDSGSVGDAWRELTGNRVIGTLDTKVGDNGDEQQVYKQWRPAGK